MLYGELLLDEDFLYIIMDVARDVFLDDVILLLYKLELVLVVFE